MNSFTITVTEAHLKKAIEAAKYRIVDICRRCVVAQALTEVPGLGFRSMAYESARTDAGNFFCQEAGKITYTSSTDVLLKSPSQISALLPLTLTFTRRN